MLSALSPRGAPVQRCVSLGPSCHAAEFLRVQNLTRCTLPFDWIHSSPQMVCLCLEDSCEALLSRRFLDSVHVSGVDASGSAKTPRRQRMGHHRRFRTQRHAHIFRHHDPAVRDDDFVRLHRAADRWRRILKDAEPRTLFLHLETDASPVGSSTFIDDSRAMFDSLCAQGSSNFALVTIRAVPGESAAASGIMAAAASGPASSAGMCERELHDEERDDARRLLVLELIMRTNTVIPFSRLAPKGTPDERADVETLAAALDARFEFDILEEPSPRTASTDAARLLYGPRWLWQHPSKQGPCVRATATELQHATALFPGAVSKATGTRAADKEEDVEGKEVEEIDVAAFAEEWAHAMGDRLSVRELRGHAKRLATPSRRSPNKAALVATVLGYQCSEMRAEAEGDFV
mmetsp:Transcript_45214/g.96138  ORF Transcript_45214/g.96138 Transcript_45214/m.96138 type:complete len:405 (-) Transcript_45214:204-1418(-)